MGSFGRAVILINLCSCRFFTMTEDFSKYFKNTEVTNVEQSALSQYKQADSTNSEALLNGIICISHATKIINKNATDVDVVPKSLKTTTVKDNLTLVNDSQLSASERTRRLLPYMAFYVPVQDLSINEEYQQIPTTNQVIRPSIASGTLLGLPQRYVHTKLSSLSEESTEPRSSLFPPSASTNTRHWQYEPSAGDVYHKLTYGGPHHQHHHYNTHSQQPLKEKDSIQKHHGQHLQNTPGLTGSSAPSNVNLPSDNRKQVRQKTVQHFPPLSQSTPVFIATPSAEQQNVETAYRPQGKQKNNNLTPFTPSNSEPGNFVPIVYTPLKGNRNNIVLTSHARALSHTDTMTRLNIGEKPEKIEHSPTFSPAPTQSTDEIEHHHYPQQPHILPQSQPLLVTSLDLKRVNAHYPNSYQQSQYLSIPANNVEAKVAIGNPSRYPDNPSASTPSTYEPQNKYQHHQEHEAFNTSSRPNKEFTLIGSNQHITPTQLRYRTKIEPLSTANFFYNAELQQPQQFRLVDQSQTAPLLQSLVKNEVYVNNVKYKQRINQETKHNKPSQSFSSTDAAHNSPVSGLTTLHPIHSSIQVASKYPHHSPKHRTLVEPDNKDASASFSHSQVPFAEQILTIPVGTIFADYRSKQSPQNSQSPLVPPKPLTSSLSSHSLTFNNLKSPSTDQYCEDSVEEPQQSLDDDTHQNAHVGMINPTLGPPTHAYIIVTTAAPTIRQPLSYKNYGSTVRPVHKNNINVRLLQMTKDKNLNHAAITQSHPSQEPIISITPLPNTMGVNSAPKYVYVKEEFGQKLSTPVIKIKPLRKIETNKKFSTEQTSELSEYGGTSFHVLAPQRDAYPKHNLHNQIEVPIPTSFPPPSGNLADSNELPDIRTASLAEILHKLQESNHLPHTLTPDNIDNSIKTLIRILNNLKQTQRIVVNPPQHHKKPESTLDDYDYSTSSEQENGKHPLPNDLNALSQAVKANKHPGPSTGRPGIDYPNYAEIPQTSFDCRQQRYKGFFGDPETSCQVWHYCDLNGGKASFLCPNGTIFSQIALTCDWWFNVKCASTAQLYVLNERLYKYILPFTPKFPEDFSGPLVDKYLAMKFQEMEEKMRLEKEKVQRESGIEHEQIREEPLGEIKAGKIVVDTTTMQSPFASTLSLTEKKSESINSQVSEQSSERNLLIDDEVSDISQRVPVDSINTTKTTINITSKEQEIPLSLKPIVVSSTIEPDYEEKQRNKFDPHVLTNKTEMVSAKANDIKITVEKIEVIEIKPDGATGHIIREMIPNNIPF